MNTGRRPLVTFGLFCILSFDSRNTRDLADIVHRYRLAKRNQTYKCNHSETPGPRHWCMNVWDMELLHGAQTGWVFVGNSGVAGMQSNPGRVATLAHRFRHWTYKVGVALTLAAPGRFDKFDRCCIAHTRHRHFEIRRHKYKCLLSVNAFCFGDRLHSYHFCSSMRQSTFHIVRSLPCASGA